MRVEIRIQRSNLRRWHRSLAERLKRTFDDCEVRFRLVDGDTPLAASVTALLALERMILQRSRPTLYDRISEADAGPQRSAEFTPDIVLDCSGLEPGAVAGASERAKPYAASNPQASVPAVVRIATNREVAVIKATSGKGPPG